MVKMIALVKRKQGLSREEYVRYHEGVHARLIEKVASTLRGYSRNYVITQVAPQASEPLFDGIIEFWYDDITPQDVLSYYASNAGKEVSDDESRFIDRDSMVLFIVEEHVSSI